MSDFATINPQLVDAQSELSPKEQAQLFISECHKRDIKVVVDLPSCGAFDLFINRPDLFVLDKDGSAFIPSGLFPCGNIMNKAAMYISFDGHTHFFLLETYPDEIVVKLCT